jgi:hypothetical protein
MNFNKFRRLGDKKEKEKRVTKRFVECFSVTLGEQAIC